MLAKLAVFFIKKTEKTWLQTKIATAEKCGEKGELWSHFELESLPGDEIWTFSTPLAMWASLCGRSGYAYVRCGKIISYHITVMN